MYWIPALSLLAAFGSVMALIYWYRSWRKKNPIKVPKPPREFTEYIIHTLRIVMVVGQDSHQLENRDFRTLWVIYHWYLTKDSPKYNVVHKNGMYVIHRKDIETMALDKSIRREYKEINDET